MNRKTININADIHTQLVEFSHIHHWPISYIIERLAIRYMAGHFSGSMADVIRENAGLELEAE